MKKLNYFTIIPRLKKIAASSIVVTAISIFLLYFHVSLFAIIPICVACYFALLALFGEPLLRELFRVVRPIEQIVERQGGSV